MNNLEYIAQLHSLGLELKDAAAFHGVNRSTVQRWVNGEIKIPLKAEKEITALRKNIDRAVSEGVKTISENPETEVCLIIYPADIIGDFLPEFRDIPASVHSKMLERIYQQALDKGLKARLVSMNVEAYAEYLRVNRLRDTQVNRAEWACRYVEKLC